MSKVQINKSSDLSTVERQVLATRAIEIKKFITSPDSHNALLALEDESGYFREKALSGEESPIRYIGTKLLLSCLFVCIFNNDGEYFFAHLSNNNQMDFVSSIAKFENRDNIKVLILGGAEETRTFIDVSSQIFSYVLAQLKEVAKSFDTTITVEGQKILNHNKIEASEEENWSYYNMIMHISMNVFVFLYSTSLNAGFLQDDFSLENFGKPASVKIKEEKLLEFLGFLNYASSRYALLFIDRSASVTAIPKWLLPERDGSNPASCQNAFYNALGGAISKAGLPLIKKIFKEKMIFWSPLSHVVLDIKSHTVHPIPAYTPTYLEAARSMIKFNPERFGYFKFYDNQQYELIKLSKSLDDRLCDTFWAPKFTSDEKDQTLQILTCLKLKDLNKLEEKSFDDLPLQARQGIRNYLAEKKYLVNYLASKILLSVKMSSLKSHPELAQKQILNDALRFLMSASIQKVSAPLFNQSLLANRLYAFFGAAGISCPGRGCAGRAPHYIAEYAIDAGEAPEPITLNR